MQWINAPDIDKEIRVIIFELGLGYLDPERIFCFRSYGSSSRALARIWSLPRIWQQALSITPAYCVEILSEKFDKMNTENKKRILIHELLHIPKNFSGTLLPHRKSRGLSYNKRVELLFRQILNSKPRC